MKKDYSVYKFYKGEQKCPYLRFKDTIDNSTRVCFWGYEKDFEYAWQNNSAADWNAWFREDELGAEFIKLLRPTDYERPTDKSGVFKLYLKTLFTNRLPGKEKYYYSLTATAQ